jgi:hypothetical protein
MKPKIENTDFGSITIDGEVYGHDVVIRTNGKIKKRKKRLSKAVYGTSHTLSLDEARDVFKHGAAKLIIGTGQYGVLNLSDEATAYFRKKECRVELFPTPEAIRKWNESQGSVIGLFHVTC